MKKTWSAIRWGLGWAGSLAWTFVVWLILCAFLGTFVDNTFRTPPTFLRLGAILGAMGGIWQDCRMIRKELRKPN